MSGLAAMQMLDYRDIWIYSNELNHGMRFDAN